MAYAKVNWVNGTTPENAATLGQMDQGIADAHAGLPPPPAGQEGKWLTVSGGAMVWAPAPAGGADLSYDGDYSAASTYQDGDVVVYNGVAYLCVGGPTTTAPDVTPWGGAGFIRPTYGTSLPASPADGQEHILVDSLTNPSYQWRFRYNASSVSAYKWEFIGGSRWGVEGLSQTALPASPIDIPGSSLTLPRAGDWMAEFGGDMYATAAATYTQVALKRGAAALNITADSIADSAPQGAGATNNHSRLMRVNAMAAGDILKLQGQSNSTNGIIRTGYLFITPVRVA